jgi:hypothetical protein
LGNPATSALTETNSFPQREVEGGTLKLHVSFYLALKMATNGRKAIECELIQKYDPPCNLMLSPLAAMLHGLETR